MGKKKGKKLSMIEQYMEDAGGSFITAGKEGTDVEEGQEYQIKAVTLDEESFDKPYINVAVDDRGDDAVIRLGSKNLTRVIKKLGSNEKDWIGNFLRVLDTEYYDGLGKYGILWTARKAKE